MTKEEAIKNQFDKAIDRFEEVLKQDKNEFIRDSAIQRFEIVMDLAWKYIKTKLEAESITVHSPNNAFREAFKLGFIKNDGDWINFYRMRNETSHMYKVELAEKVYEELPKVLEKLKELQSVLG